MVPTDELSLIDKQHPEDRVLEYETTSVAAAGRLSSLQVSNISYYMQYMILVWQFANFYFIAKFNVHQHQL